MDSYTRKMKGYTLCVYTSNVPCPFSDEILTTLQKSFFISAKATEKERDREREGKAERETEGEMEK